MVSNPLGNFLWENPGFGSSRAASGVNWASPQARNIIAALPMNEGDGSNLRAVGKAEYSGSLYGSYTWESGGPIGPCVSFNDGYGLTPTISELAGSDSFAIFGWLWTGYSKDECAIFSCGSAFANDILFGLWRNLLFVQINNGSDGNRQIILTDPFGRWLHVGFSYSGSISDPQQRVSIYCNGERGELDGTYAYPAISSSSDQTAGNIANYSAYPSGWRGVSQKLQDLRIYRSVTDDQVRAMYKNPMGLYVKPRANIINTLSSAARRRNRLMLAMT